MPSSAAVERQPQKRAISNSRHQQAVVSMFRTVNYVRRLGDTVFESHGITRQQYNVLRILNGAVPDGLPTLEIAERLLEQAPGITRLLDRLEAKKLVRRERPAGNRRQVLCFITHAGVDLVHELDAPLKDVALKSLHKLSKSDLEELMRLLALVHSEDHK